MLLHKEDTQHSNIDKNKPGARCDTKIAVWPTFDCYLLYKLFKIFLRFIPINVISFIINYSYNMVEDYMFERKYAKNQASYEKAA